MRWTATGSIGAALLVLAAAPTAPARAGEELVDGYATVEIASESARRGDAALLDDAWLEGLVYRSVWGGSLVEAATMARLPESGQWKGLSAFQIGWGAVGSATIEKRDAPGLLVIHARGRGGEASLLANAVAQWMVRTAQNEARARADKRRAVRQERFNVAETRIRLLNSDKVSSLQNLASNPRTFAIDLERLEEERRALGHEADELQRGLALDEATYRELKAALADPAKTDAAVANHLLVLRDDHVRDLAEEVAASQGRRDELLALGMSKDHPDVAKADRETARAEAARVRAVLRIVSTFVRDYEDRQTRRARAEAELARNAAGLGSMIAVRDHVSEIDAEIERVQEKRRELLAELDAMSSGETNDAISVVTTAWPPAEK